MASGVQALEALLDDESLVSSFTTPLAVHAPEGKFQGTAASPDTLNSRNNRAASSPPAKLYVPAQYGVNLHVWESSGATMPICSGDDKLDALSKQIELVSTEVRELIKSVAELRTEVRDLRSTLTASKSVTSSEGHLPPATPSRETVEHFASPTSTDKARAGPSHKQSTVEPFNSPQLFPVARSQPKAEITPVNSYTPNPVVQVPSSNPLKPSSALVVPKPASDETSTSLSRSQHAPKVSKVATPRDVLPEVSGPVPLEADGPKRGLSGAQLKLSSLMRLGSDRRAPDKGRRLKAGQGGGSWWSSRGAKTPQEGK